MYILIFLKKDKFGVLKFYEEFLLLISDYLNIKEYFYYKMLWWFVNLYWSICRCVCSICVGFNLKGELIICIF